MRYIGQTIILIFKKRKTKIQGRQAKWPGSHTRQQQNQSLDSLSKSIAMSTDDLRDVINYQWAWIRNDHRTVQTEFLLRQEGPECH